MKSTSSIAFIALSLLCLVGCKTTSPTQSKELEESPDIQTEKVKLNPSEAYIQIKLIEKKSSTSYVVEVEKLLQQSFGFSTYIKQGDSILISSKNASLSDAIPIRVIIKDRPKFGEGSAFDFRLAK